MIESFERISSLAKQFEENREDYHSKKYDESNTRTDFIDKFFEALGWDVRNNQGHAENYREVIREDKIMIEGKQKAPDYAFRIGGTVKFYVEAKKPSVDIKNDIDASYQLRRYAYTAKLPLSILTDFAEFAVYDTRIKPKPTDNASVARIFYCKSSEYEKQWEFIEQTFAKEAILKGSFDKYIKDPKRKKGTSEVDKEFLKQIESWREDLALNIALRNKDLSIYDLNFAIQKIIDRIIFLRIAEDRGMEEYGALRKLSQNSETKFHIYAELIKYFKKADEKYNSGLFDLNEDKVTTKLTIDYKIFANIIDNLYYPNSPYEFSVLPIEILGNIYEQFLGKTIRLTEGHRAKVEDKPEVRKAGGVYYTPQYIVDYIVKNTLGEKLKEKTPKQIEELTVLDPACGSGSFLITAYEYFLNFYLDYYSSEKQRDKALKDKKIFEIGERGYKLGIDEKKEILTRHIYGVDIDSQAVEVTKLSLLLKLMEDERLETSQYLFTRRAMKLLPDLSSNIKCGNSLISNDFYTGQQVEMFDDEMVRKINAFDWDKQFPKIFSRGGFDVVIGNPPYIKEYTNKDAFIFKKGKLGKYYQGKMDIWTVFASIAIDFLKSDGTFSFIAPNNWLTNAGASCFREKILSEGRIVALVDFGDYKVFNSAGIQTMILVFNRMKKLKSFETKYLKMTNKLLGEEDIRLLLETDKITKTSNAIFYQSTIKPEKVKNGSIAFSNELNEKVLDKIESKRNFTLLNSEVAQGIVGDPDDAFVFINAHNYNKNEDKIFHDYYTSVKKYHQGEVRGLIAYLNNEIKDIENYPSIKKQLNEYTTQLKNRREVKNGRIKWFHLHWPRDRWYFDEGEKIVCAIRTSKPSCYYTNKEYYGSRAMNFIKTERIDLLYLTGILNSKLSYYWLKNRGKQLGDLLQIDKGPLINIPICIANSEIRKKEVMNLVSKIIKYYNDLNQNEKSSKKGTLIESEISRLEHELDILIYLIYDLTNHEIEIVEKGL